MAPDQTSYNSEENQEKKPTDKSENVEHDKSEN